MDEKKVQIFLMDQAPRIGCGWRLVNVKLGHKWAHLTVPSTGVKAKLRRNVFDGLAIRRLPNESNSDRPHPPNHN